MRRCLIRTAVPLRQLCLSVIALTPFGFCLPSQLFRRFFTQPAFTRNDVRVTCAASRVCLCRRGKKSFGFCRARWLPCLCLRAVCIALAVRKVAAKCCAFTSQCARAHAIQALLPLPSKSRYNIPVSRISGASQVALNLTTETLIRNQPISRVTNALHFRVIMAVDLQ